MTSSTLLRLLKEDPDAQREKSFSSVSFGTGLLLIFLVNRILLQGNFNELGGSMRGIIPLYGGLFFTAAWIIPGRLFPLTRKLFIKKTFGALGAALLTLSVHLSLALPRGGHLQDVSGNFMEGAVLVGVLIVFILFLPSVKGSFARRFSRITAFIMAVSIFIFISFPVFKLKNKPQVLRNELVEIPFLTDFVPKYNCIIIMIDTLRADRMPPKSNPVSATSLASRSMVFSNARSTSSWTVPAVVSTFTSTLPAPESYYGRLVDRDHFREKAGSGAWKDTWFSSMKPTLAIQQHQHFLPEILHAAGYRTAAFVNNPLLAAWSGFDRGFDRFRQPLQLDLKKGNPKSLFSSTLAGKTGIFGTEVEEVTVSGQLARDGNLVDEAVDWISTGADKPFFIWLHLMSPHIPYAPARPPAPPPGYDGLIIDSFPVEALEMCRTGRYSPDSLELDRIIRLYDREVAETDSLLGLLINNLETADILDNTLVILTSDHGEEFGEHAGIEHGHSMYDELLRIPLIIHCPWMLEAGVSGTGVSLLDIFPTVLDLLGINIDSVARGLEGHSLAGTGDDKRQNETGEQFCAGTLYGPPLAALLENEFKMIHNLSSGSIELYNLEKDPMERLPLDPSLSGEMLIKLRAWGQDARSIESVRADDHDTRLMESLKSIGYLN